MVSSYEQSHRETHDHRHAADKRSPNYIHSCSTILILFIIYMIAVSLNIYMVNQLVHVRSICRLPLGTAWFPPTIKLPGII